MLKTQSWIFVLMFLLTARFCIAQNRLGYWLTKADGTVLLQKQESLSGSTEPNRLPTIAIDDSKSFQIVDGFGYTLTGGSAFVINRLDGNVKEALLQELFGKNKNSISISYLRISIGASDLNLSPFTYDDIPSGTTDLNLEKFSLKEDEKDLIPLLQKIIRINPKIKILGSPWSAPLWMKNQNSFQGGRLNSVFYDIYAKYFVRYIEEMAKFGIKIDAITTQNEPLHDGNNPSMLMSAAEQVKFIGNYLGKAFQVAHLKTKIIIYDHNCDKPEYPLEVLNDENAEKYIDGAAFHLYNGAIECLSQVHNAFPTKNVYFTEQYTSSKSSFSHDLRWHLRNVIIGTMRNWSRNVLEWNLASDANLSPHTIGGCTICQGALTIDGQKIKRNVSYYIIAHASKFVPPNSRRIESNVLVSINNVAFKTPRGEIVLIAQNESKKTVNFNIKYRKGWAEVALEGGSVGTFVWR